MASITFRPLLAKIENESRFTANHLAVVHFEG